MSTSSDEHRGSFLCERYELRITGRCLQDDLGMHPETSFAEASRHEIVRAFREKRRDQPFGAKTVGPAAGVRTLFHLGQGDDHRGATWFDRDDAIVWLCAYGFHRSGQPEDSFQHFDRLRTEQRIYPDEEDYLRLEVDRGARFAELGPIEGPEFAALALASPGEVQERLMGRTVPVRLLADIVDDIAELTVGIPSAIYTPELGNVVMRSLVPEEGAAWDLADPLPGATPIEEVAFRVLRPHPH